MTDFNPGLVSTKVSKPVTNAVPMIPDTVYVSFSAEIVPHTTESLIGLLSEQVNKGVKNIYLMLSTPGGSVMHGMNLYNVLRGMPLHLTTHNVGNVDSIGNAVFLAGEKRYACNHSTFMFHGVGFGIARLSVESSGSRVTHFTTPFSF